MRTSVASWWNLACLVFLLALADPAYADLQACCPSGGGACQTIEQGVCESSGGTSLLGATCDGPTACCEASGCSNMADPCTCLAAGGTPTLAECSDHQRPCCFPEGTQPATCQVMDPVCCTQQGGLPLFGTATGASSCDSTATCCSLEGPLSDQDPCSCVLEGGVTTPGATTCCGKADPPAPANIPMPFASLTDLCNSFGGFPVPPNLIPPPNPACSLPGPPANCETVPRNDEAFTARFTQFVRDQQYTQLGWHKDAVRRQTGPYLLGANPGQVPGGQTYGTHHVVRVHYSPEVTDWLCRGTDSPQPKHCSGSSTACTMDGDCPTDEVCVEGRYGFCENSNDLCVQNSDCPGTNCDLRLQPGSMIVKEMWKTGGFRVDDADQMWIDEACYDDTPDAWAVMVRGRDGSHDDWFWVLFGNMFDFASPPILGRSAVTAADFFDDPTSLVNHAQTHYPTGEQHRITDANGDWVERKKGSVVDPNYGFNSRQDCLACHGSAASAATFANLGNVLGGSNVDLYPFCATTGTPGPCPAPDCPGSGAHTTDPLDLSQHTYANPLPQPDPDFVGLFPQFGAGVPFADVLESRLPAESYDHVVTTAGGVNRATLNAEQFVTSDQCLGCHDATSLITGANMVQCVGSCTTDADCRTGCGAGAVCNGSQQCETTNGVECTRQINHSPYAEWRVSPMGLAGRDPIFFAQVQTETNLTPSLEDCIETYCLHCHSSMAQRQKAIEAPQAPQCSGMLDPDYGPDSFHALFTRDDLNAWPGDESGLVEPAKYAALGRDGVSCAVCHHMSGDGLSPSVQPTRMTANFDVGPAEVIHGPYTAPVTDPMQNSLGITPGFAPQIKQAGLCGTCHVLRVPVLDELIDGSIPLACLSGPDTVGSGPQAIAACELLSEDDPCVVGGEGAGLCRPYFTFEQTTYLEFLNSDAELDTTCQDCHMPSTHKNGTPLEYQIANVQVKPDGSNGWPENPNVTVSPLPTRGGMRCNAGPNIGASCLVDEGCPGGQCERYGRHLLYGLNVFLNEMAQEFPLLLGLRQIDPMTSADPPVMPALLAAREAVLDQAENQTATIQIEQASLVDSLLTVDVTVANLTGHKFPSGVGFRRAFIELLVCETEGCTCDNGALWGSGCTDSLGVILNGPGGDRLASEFRCPDDPGATSPSPACPPPPIPFGQGCAAIQGPDSQCYQRHYSDLAPIFFEDEVQIYQELVAACDGRFTTSVTHLCDDIKDNRLLPTGWRSTGPFAGSTKPGPEASLDPDYISGGLPVSGADTVSYVIDLPEPQASLVHSVRATLYFQAIPPSFLNDRFHDAFQGAAQSDDIERLYYMTSRLNVAAAQDDARRPFLEDWKLELVSAAQTLATGAGDVPQLLLDRLGPDELLLQWGDSCLPGDIDYEIYEGALGDFAVHFPVLCSTGGLTSQSLFVVPGDFYYLVVPTNGAVEGSYGRDSDQVERPVGLATCWPQQILSCP